MVPGLGEVMTTMSRKDQLKQLLSSTSALLEAMRYSASTASGEAANIGRYGSYKAFLRKYNELAKQAAPLLQDTKMLDVFNLDKIKGSADCTWPQQKEYFDIAYSSAALLKSLVEGQIGYAEDETHVLMDFIQANLRRTVFTLPERENEVQNGIEALFVGRSMAKGTDYDRETGRVKTSGKESVPDFVIPRLKLCLEVKLSKSAEKLREIVDEINADIRAYGTQYERQLYVVYDLGVIRDELEFKRGLEDASGVSVLIVKH
jgi:DpnII restriction endonuclease